TINIIDDFNTYHGNTVYEIAHNIASDADIVKTNIATSGNTLQSYDYIANSINTSGAFDIYNASWQIPSSDTVNAARAIYDSPNNTKTYATAQDYMYDITSYNFITQIRNSAIDNDSVFVWAAGNESKTESGALSALPLAFPELMGHFVNVVAVDNNNNLAWYSNQCGITQNYCIAAPGSGWNTNAEDYASGTSFAAPVISGAIATIKEAFPYMDATKITQLLFVTAQDLGETGVDSVYGWGLLDMEKATRPVGTPKIVLSNETILPLNLSAVSGSAATAIKNANVKIAFVDDFGRAFTTNLSDNINIIPYGRGFEKLTESENDSVILFDSIEFGSKQNHMLESSGLVSTKSNSLTNFIGYKNEFNLNNIRFYQTARFGLTNPTADENSLISGFSNIYSTSLKMGAQFNKFALEVAMPDTIVSGDMYLNTPVAMDNSGKLIYNNTAISLTNRPSVEYTIKYGALSATFVENPDYQNEFFIMAKTKFAF
ncbi:MAG: S8 family serine peptidase, partial [Alphaproteobacteria bacterium]|nr:S8 family serine peptidase [Alphaproteobacteria bacterium]